MPSSDQIPHLPSWAYYNEQHTLCLDIKLLLRELKLPVTGDNIRLVTAETMAIVQKMFPSVHRKVTFQDGQEIEF